MCDKDGKCDLTNLSEYDKKINELKLNDMYYGTSFVCIVYGIIAVSILMASVISPVMKDIFFDQFLIFTIVFIIGSIIIISVLIYFINYYEVKKIKHINVYDTYSCPDYWNMVTLDDNNVYKNFDSNISPNYFKYKCVLNNDIFNKFDIYKSSSSINNASTYNLTNNLSNTINIAGENKITDSYNVSKSRILQENIETSNLGHLYKNINDPKVFYLDKNHLDENNFAYIRPGNKLTTDYLSNIRDEIIHTSLIMNNYQYTNENNTYSNIPFNSYNDKNDPYISWNYNNITDKENEITDNVPNDTIEKYDIYDWRGLNRDLTYNNYKSYFMKTDKTSLNVLATDVPTTTLIYVGTIKIEDNNIFFKSHFNDTRSYKLNKYKDTNKIYNSYIDTTKDTNYTSGTIYTSEMLRNFDGGPTIIINTKKERPIAITKQDIIVGKNIPVVCDTIYPAYLASIEDTNTYGADNAIRCSYAKLCGYSWSDMGCN